MTLGLSFGVILHTSFRLFFILKSAKTGSIQTCILGIRKERASHISFRF